MLVAYLLNGPDNDSFMLAEDQRDAKNPGPFCIWRFYLNGLPHPACCRTCGRKIDSNYVNPSYRVAKRRFDFAGTYDGYDIVSSRFKAFCEKRKLGAEFIPLPADADFFWIRAKKIVKCDLTSGQTEVANKCSTCGKYHDIIGTDSVLWRAKKPPATGLYRSDLEFASGHEQSPLLLVDVNTGRQMKRMRFGGLELEPIERPFES
jgi:hypothetical protein